MTQIRPTRDRVRQWGNTYVNKWLREGIEQSREEYITEQAAAWAMEQAARICDTFNPDESNPLTIEGQCADAIRAAIPKEKE